ncbi:Kelch-type beta propeller [Ascosphaera apis ARSEF 7405]|uniref:Kelch-type beta propeller n=1 Tax=Ascosphaera apis ARSEF 7405 TaxID=392613 RepID=A0A166NVW7_9EURO|nr:Kelch-type beta propeller [Ascosphaera apis ARSEF 7405]
MSLPKPPVSLDGGCSVIDNDTLYVYTPSALLELPLKRHGKWKTLPMGEPVTGGACTKGPDGLYILGGTSTTPGYSGFQRYSYKDGSWQTLQLAGNGGDLRNRVHHSAIYIEGQDSFFVYAGVQDGSDSPSTTTFLISAQAPYDITSFPPSGALQAIDPTLVSWDPNTVAFVGATADRTQIWTFSNGQWQNTGAVLGQPLPQKSQAGVAMLHGADGSKILEIFDMSTSPNTVSSWLLYENNQPIPAPGKQIGQSKSSKQSRRARDITAENFPAYNGKYAGGQARSQFTIAQDGNKLVAIVGGDDKVPVALFDQSKNSWLDPSQVFLNPTSTTSATSSATSSSSTSTSSTSITTSAATTSSTTTTSSSASITSGAVNSSSSTGPSTGTIVGATVGSVLGLLAIILLILLACCLKRRKARKGAQGGVLEKNGDGFQDQGLQSLQKNPGPMGISQPVAVESSSSLAIMAGKGLTAEVHAVPGNTGASPLRNMSMADSGSGSAVDSSASTAVPGVTSSRFTDEGWGKYFEGGDDGDSRRSGLSEYSENNRSAYNSHVPRGLSVDLSAVKMGKVEESPVTEHRGSMIPPLIQQEGMTAQFGNTGDWDDDRSSTGGDRFSSSAKDHDSWDQGGAQWPPSRIASSAYSGVGQSNDSRWRRSSLMGGALPGDRDSSFLQDLSVLHPHHEHQETDTSQLTTWTDVENGGKSKGPTASTGSPFLLPEFKSSGRPDTNMTDLTAWPDLYEADERQHHANPKQTIGQDLSWIDLGNQQRH